MNDFLTMVNENFVPSGVSRHHHARRRPRRLNCDKKTHLTNVIICDGDEDAEGGDHNSNWDMIPAPPITPPAAFLPTDGYKRLSALRKGKLCDETPLYHFRVMAKLIPPPKILWIVIMIYNGNQRNWLTRIQLDYLELSGKALGNIRQHGSCLSYTLWLY